MSEYPASYPDLRNRVAVVTGAAQGIGRSIAERLAAEGCRVGLIDIQDDKCAQVADAIAEKGGVALALHCDISQKAEVQRATASVLEAFGRIHILVNNAAILSLTPFEELSVEEWDRVLAVNLRGPFLMAQAIAPLLTGQGWGRIVQISADAGEAGAQFYGVHWAVSSAGVINLTRCLAPRLAPQGVTVNTVAASATESPQVEALDPALVQKMHTFFPVGRIGRPEEVAALVAFLCSTQAAFINGATIDINGGALIR